MVSRAGTEGPWSDAVRRRVAAVALSVMLFALVAMWSGEVATPRRRPARAPRPRRGRAPLRTPVVACETIAGGARVYRLDLAACPPPARRLRRFRPEEPRPWDLN